MKERMRQITMFVLFQFFIALTATSSYFLTSSSSQFESDIILWATFTYVFSVMWFVYQPERFKTIVGWLTAVQYLSGLLGFLQAVFWVLQPENSMHEPRVFFIFAIAGLASFLKNEGLILSFEEFDNRLAESDNQASERRKILKTQLEELKEHIEDLQLENRNLKLEIEQFEKLEEIRETHHISEINDEND